MRAVVTGAAGFIGSTLVDRLLSAGHEVVGIDAFREYYDPDEKRRNLEQAQTDARFELRQADLTTFDSDEVLDGADVVFHLAAQPGVRHSWADFERYDLDNVLATQRLLEAARRHPVGRFVYSSSSSIYGNAARYPTKESDLPAPHSPYGVTKLAAEHLCALYARNWGVPTVSLRYFTVHGPRQRPDMAIRRLIDAALTGRPFPLFGDGSQSRDVTYVDDVVEANMAAATAHVEHGAVFNIAAGCAITLNELIEAVESATGAMLSLERQPPSPGDVVRTGGDIDQAAVKLGWRPRVAVKDGIARQVAWQTALLGR